MMNRPNFELFELFATPKTKIALIYSLTHRSLRHAIETDSVDTADSHGKSDQCLRF